MLYKPKDRTKRGRKKIATGDYLLRGSQEGRKEESINGGKVFQLKRLGGRGIAERGKYCLLIKAVIQCQGAAGVVERGAYRIKGGNMGISNTS